eukprot:scaffold70157_cov55-Phaeocystis_antarctica.AAC.3
MVVSKASKGRDATIPGCEPEHAGPHAADAAAQARHVRGGYAREQLGQDGDVGEVETEREAAPRQHLLEGHLDVVLYDDGHAADEHALILARREAVASGGEAELGCGVVLHVLLHRHLLHDSVVEGHDEHAGVRLVRAVGRLAHAEGVVAPPVEVHLAREKHLALEGRLGGRKAQRREVDGRRVARICGHAVDHAAALLGVELLWDPAVELRLLAVEGRHAHVLTLNVVTLRHAVDQRLIGRRAPVVNHHEGRRLGHLHAHVTVALVLRHHHHVVAPSVPLPVLRPRLLDVGDGVAQGLMCRLRKVLEVVAVRVVAEREV